MGDDTTKPRVSHKLTKKLLTVPRDENGSPIESPWSPFSSPPSNANQILGDQQQQLASKPVAAPEVVAQPRRRRSSVVLPADGSTVTLGVPKHKRSKSQTGLIIEYFDGGRDGEQPVSGAGETARPSVRVRVAPSSKRAPKDPSEEGYIRIREVDTTKRNTSAPAVLPEQFDGPLPRRTMDSASGDKDAATVPKKSPSPALRLTPGQNMAVRMSSADKTGDAALAGVLGALQPASDPPREDSSNHQRTTSQRALFSPSVQNTGEVNQVSEGVKQNSGAEQGAVSKRDARPYHLMFERVGGGGLRVLDPLESSLLGLQAPAKPSKDTSHTDPMELGQPQPPQSKPMEQNNQNIQNFGSNWGSNWKSVNTEPDTEGKSPRKDRTRKRGSLAGNIERELKEAQLREVLRASLGNEPQSKATPVFATNPGTTTAGPSQQDHGGSDNSPQSAQAKIAELEAKSKLDRQRHRVDVAKLADMQDEHKELLDRVTKQEAELQLMMQHVKNLEIEKAAESQKMMQQIKSLESEKTVAVDKINAFFKDKKVRLSLRIGDPLSRLLKFAEQEFSEAKALREAAAQSEASKDKAPKPPIQNLMEQATLRRRLESKTEELSTKVSAHRTEMAAMTTERLRSEAKMKEDLGILIKKHEKEKKDTLARHERLVKDLQTLLDEKMAQIKETELRQRNQLEQYEVRFKTELTDQKKQEEETIQQLIARQGNEIAEVVARHDYKTQSIKRHYQEKMSDMDRSHSQVVEDLSSQVALLRDDMLETRGFVPASDIALKQRHRELRLIIETICEPLNLGVTSFSGGLEAGLDPNRFLSRAGNQALKYLLRSMVWQTIMDGFFKVPFGFGVLGSDNGYKLLFGVYKAWVRLYEGDAGFARYQGPDALDPFDPFKTNSTANKWRSATFQSIIYRLRGSSEGENPFGEGLARMYAANQHEVSEKIEHLLVSMSSPFSGHVTSLRGEVKNKISELARQCAELALEVGARPGQVDFDMPQKGDSVMLGQDFIDIIDGDVRQAAETQVDLCVSPSVYVVGDGGKDLESVRTICIGEIYSLNDHSSVPKGSGSAGTAR